MSWRKVKAVVIRDLKLLLREKATLFWLFIFPLILLSGYVALFAPQGSTSNVKSVLLNVAVVPGSRNESFLNATKELIKYLKEPSNTNDTWRIRINATIMYSMESTLEKLRKGYFDAVVYLPANAFSRRGLNVTLYVLRGTPDTVKEQLVVSYFYSFFTQSAQFSAMGMLSEFINKTALLCPETRESASTVLEEAWKMALEPYVKIVNITPGEKDGNLRSRVIGWMTLSVVFMDFMFGGILGGASSITSEIRRGFIHRLLATKLKPSEYFGAMAISWIATLTVSTLPVIVLGFGIYGGTLVIKPFSVDAIFTVLIILVTMVLSFSLGILIGILARSPEAANIIANLVVWATMIGGGFWLPKFMLPDFLRLFADINLISILFYAVTEIAVYGRGIAGYFIPTIVAVVSSLVLFGLASIIYVRYLPKLLESTETG